MLKKKLLCLPEVKFGGSVLLELINEGVSRAVELEYNLVDNVTLLVDSNVAVLLFVSKIDTVVVIDVE